MLKNEPHAYCSSNGTDHTGSDRRSASQSKPPGLNQSIALSQIVTLMMQSPNYRHYSLSDLEWMVLPPLKLGQLALAETRPDPNGPTIPLAVMLWAFVSAEVDKRITSNLAAPIRLRPDEWRSGNILWLADMIGDKSTGHELIKNVMGATLVGNTLRVRSLSVDGKPTILELSGSSFSAIEAPGPAARGQSGAPASGMVCPACVATGCTGRCRTGKVGQPESVRH